jgi:diguanylate cyclase (GGDEF)-like protein/PAS domain S-box-containing protein
MGRIRRWLNGALPLRTDTEFRARTLGTLMLLGTLLGALSLLLPNDVRNPDTLRLVFAATGLAGAGVFAAGARLRGWRLHAAIVTASLLANLAILASGIATGLYGLSFFWIVILCASFFGPRAVGAHLALLLATFAVVLSRVQSTGFSNLTRWLLAAFALGTAAALASWLGAMRDRARRRAQRFFDLSFDLLCTAGSNGFFIEVNDAWTRTLGHSRRELLGRPFVDFVHPEDHARTIEETARLFGGRETVDFENRYRARDGSWHWLLWRAVLAPDDGLVYARATDVTERRRLELDRERLLEEVRSQARTDALTQLPNRRWLDDELRRELARSRRRGVPLCVAMLDLDHFKDYNDAHGHAAGDALLARAADAWRTELRASDFLARYGGEEFVALLPECELHDARGVVERLCQATPGGVTCSAGVARLGRAEAPEDVLGRADRALYAAKRDGRDRIVAAPDQGSPAQAGVLEASASRQ